jgi:hypothetical protein
MGKSILISIILLTFGLLLAACQTGTPVSETAVPVVTDTSPAPLPVQPEPDTAIAPPAPTDPAPEITATAALPDTGEESAPVDPLPERSSSSPLAGVDACDIYPAEEAEAALHKPVQEPENLLEAEAMFSVTSCFYAAESDRFEYTGLILVAPSDGNADFSRATFEYSRQEAANFLQNEPVDVPGLEYDAYWVGGEIRTLFILHDSIQVHLTLTTAPSDYPSQEMLEQARRILDRLP